ncbi:MAG: hypothetical protein QOG23_4447 [Blastocatellia bacterium]|jgi:hypothetical protein|nr:hypothetical protein [Blastocatellia bacterium]
MLPRALKYRLTQQVLETRKTHDGDLKRGHGAVHLPYALERKYKNVNVAQCSASCQLAPAVAQAGSLCYTKATVPFYPIDIIEAFLFSGAVAL